MLQSGKLIEQLREFALSPVAANAAAATAESYVHDQFVSELYNGSSAGIS